MVNKTLKLELPWKSGGARHVCVKDKNGDPVEVDDQRFPVGHHVERSGTYVLVKNFFGVNNRVHDVRRYCIGNAGCCVRHDNRYHIDNGRYIIPQCDVSVQQHNGIIVLLLESPHKDEYQLRNINCPIATANGSTGDNIDKCLGKVLARIENLAGRLLIAPGCHVVISNPIQFQTSLHAIHNMPLKNVMKDGVPYNWKTLRDNVWRTLWDEDHIKQCFRARLNTYQPNLIINACTGELSDSDSLTTHVNNFVCAELQNVAELNNVPLYKASHPASWRSDRNITCDLSFPQTDP